MDRRHQCRQVRLELRARTCPLTWSAIRMAAVGAAFARLVGWRHRVLWGEVFRASPALADVEFLRGYAGCPVPETLQLAVDLALDSAGGTLRLRALADRIALATGLGERQCSLSPRFAGQSLTAAFRVAFAPHCSDLRRRLQ
jgi:hypothetical protein